MATGGKKHMGRGSQGKGSGTGANTTLDKDMVGENEVLSNRDKKQHTEQRGLDGTESNPISTRTTRRTVCLRNECMPVDRLLPRVRRLRSGNPTACGGRLAKAGRVCLSEI